MSLSDLSEWILYGDFDIGKDYASRGGALHSHLILFLIHGDPFEISLDNKRGKFVSIHFGISGEEVCNSGISDELFLAIQDVILSIRAKYCRGFRIQGIRACFRLCQGIGADDLSCGEFRKITSLLIRIAEEDDWKRTDSGMGTKGGHERTTCLGHLLPEKERTDLVQILPSVLLRDVRREKS